MVFKLIFSLSLLGLGTNCLKLPQVAFKKHAATAKGYFLIPMLASALVCGPAFAADDGGASSYGKIGRGAKRWLERSDISSIKLRTYVLPLIWHSAITNNLLLVASLIAANAKITTGGASTLQSGRTIAITRGVNLDRQDFSNQNLKGVAFQQSIVRDANFKNSNLFGSSFFDATLDGTDFENTDMTQANVEMAQVRA